MCLTLSVRRAKLQRKCVLNNSNSFDSLEYKSMPRNRVAAKVWNSCTMRSLYTWVYGIANKHDERWLPIKLFLCFVHICLMFDSHLHRRSNETFWDNYYTHSCKTRPSRLNFQAKVYFQSSDFRQPGIIGQEFTVWLLIVVHNECVSMCICRWDETKPKYKCDVLN